MSYPERSVADWTGWASIPIAANSPAVSPFGSKTPIFPPNAPGVAAGSYSSRSA